MSHGIALPTHSNSYLGAISMNIYKRTNYRKIYEQHYGPIPKDKGGRTYEIHHIDGNKKNNDPANLQCVSIQEHYDIHYAQQDWGACFKLAQRMKLSAKEKSKLAKLAAEKQISEGKHNFLKREDGTSLASDMVKQGKHHLLGDGEFQRTVQQERLKKGTHNLQKRQDGTSHASDRVAAGTHNFQNKEFAKNRTQKQIASGKHPSQIKKTCNYCGRSISVNVFGKHHGENCKHAVIIKTLAN